MKSSKSRGIFAYTSAVKLLLALSIIAAATPLEAQITKSDTATMVSPSVSTGPDTLTARGRQARDVVNALRLKLAPTDSVVSVTFSGDTTARVETERPNGGATYTLHKKQGKWVVSDTSMIKIYRPVQPTKRLTFKPANGNPVLFTGTIPGTSRRESLAMIRLAVRQIPRLGRPAYGPPDARDAPRALAP